MNSGTGSLKFKDMMITIGNQVLHSISNFASFITKKETEPNVYLYLRQQYECMVKKEDPVLVAGYTLYNIQCVWKGRQGKEYERGDRKPGLMYGMPAWGRWISVRGAAPLITDNIIGHSGPALEDDAIYI
jgi:hypothetical protein